MDSMETLRGVARKFWTRSRQNAFLGSGYNHQTKVRRLRDLNFIAERTAGAESIIDIGCGDGGTMMALREVSGISEFHMWDQSRPFIRELRRRWGRHPARLHARAADLSRNPLPAIPETDVAVLLGVTPYLFSDVDVHRLLDALPAKKVILRSPCTMLPEDEVVSTYSEALGAEYAAIYRTVPNLTAMLGRRHNILESGRIWPDEIESKFGTRQFVFVLARG